MRTSYLFALALLISFTSAAFDWDQMTDFGGIARHRTTALSIGNKVYFGLGHYNGAGPNVLFDDWWEYDPATNAWTQKADYLGGLMYQAAGFTIGNIGYVGTGRDQSAALVNTFFAYDPQTNTWTQKPNFPGAGRRGAVAFAIDEYGYMGTGSNYSDFYKFDPSTDTWSAIAGMPTAGRISAVGFELDGYGYVGTGSTSSAQNDFWRYDPATDQWVQMANVGPTPRQEAAGFSIMGKGYILTGDDYSSGNNFGDMWEYTPATDTWIQIDDFPGTARRYLTCVTHGNVVYAGLGTNGTNFKDFWRYDPVAALLEDQLDQISVTPYPNPASQTLHFRVEGLENIPTDNLSLEIVTLTGTSLMEQHLQPQITTFHVHELAAGTYFYRLVYNDQVLRTDKLMIR